MRILRTDETEEVQQMIDVIKQMQILKPEASVSVGVKKDNVYLRVDHVLMFAGRQAGVLVSSSNHPDGPTHERTSFRGRDRNGRKNLFNRFFSRRRLCHQILDHTPETGTCCGSRRSLLACCSACLMGGNRSSFSGWNIQSRNGNGIGV